MVEIEASAGVPAAQPVDGAVLIVADVAASFTYASFQNAIPVIRSIGIDNGSGRQIENCKLELSASPSFLRAKTWTSGTFIWRSGSIAPFVPYRPAAGDEGRRAVSDIPLAELASVVLDRPEILEQDDPARELARLIGVKALAAAPRARLDEAIVRAKAHRAALQTEGEA